MLKIQWYKIACSATAIFLTVFVSFGNEWAGYQGNTEFYLHVCTLITAGPSVSVPSSTSSLIQYCTVLYNLLYVVLCSTVLTVRVLSAISTQAGRQADKTTAHVYFWRLPNYSTYNYQAQALDSSNNYAHNSGWKLL